MAAVSDSTTFDLNEVLLVVATSQDTLQDAVYEAAYTFPQGCWDPNYSGSKDSLYNFRNYDNGFDASFESFFTVSYYQITGGGQIELTVQNNSTNRTISAVIYWQARLAGTPIDGGSMTVTDLAGQNNINVTDSWGYYSYDEIWANVDGGPWVQIM